MRNSEYKAIIKMLKSGDLLDADSALAPFLIKGDLDARYLRSCFCLDPSISGEQHDKLRWIELFDLANLGQRDALFDVAFELYYGGELPQDRRRGFLFMAAAALLGNSKARVLSAEWIDEDGCLSVELASLVKRKPNRT